MLSHPVASHPRAGSGFEQAFPNGEPHEFDPVVDIEPLHQVFAVLLHGLVADLHGPGDQLAAEPARQVAQGLQFARREPRETRAALVAHGHGAAAGRHPGAQRGLFDSID